MTQTGQHLYQRARQRIPGGTQLLSKRPELFAPEAWPAYYDRAQGCEVWDLDDRHYYDMTHNGVGSCILGYAHPEVSRAIIERIQRGSMCTLNAPEEVELADTLCAIHPWAEQARFARCGGETCAVAVRIARATTDRSLIALCGYHGWQDWYLAANLGEDDALRGHLLPGLDPLGVPRELRGTALTFPYNDRSAFQAILDAHGPQLAAVIMEPCRNHDPEPGFLEFVRDSARAAGALLIFDEITIGWRLTYGGAHLQLGVNPDIAVFAKALGNGHPIGAIIGTAGAMHGAEGSFISSTYWTEAVGPTAALTTLRVMKETRVWEHVAHIGAMLQSRWRDQAAKHGLPVNVPDGYPCLAHFAFDHPQANELKTLFTQRMLHHGFLASTSVYPTLAHTPEILEQYNDAVDAVFGELANAVADNAVLERLEGPPAHTGFRRLL